MACVWRQRMIRETYLEADNLEDFQSFDENDPTYGSSALTSRLGPLVALCAGNGVPSLARLFGWKSFYEQTKISPLELDAIFSQTLRGCHR
mmetsp:Transcript_35236/g.80519  ORF Transcript_35236/g.80519 Transcript_35236/m.80519 type:complete len:91 (-) Transcript_35236:1032-1304(-)